MNRPDNAYKELADELYLGSSMTIYTALLMAYNDGYIAGNEAMLERVAGKLKIKTKNENK